MVPNVGLEPTTLRLRVSCSTNWTSRACWIWGFGVCKLDYYCSIIYCWSLGRLRGVTHNFDQTRAHSSFRPSSDAELFMSRTSFEFGPTPINKSTPVDSDVELNSPNLIQFEPKLLVKKPKTETACKIRYDNLCIRFGTSKVRRLNQSRSKGVLPAEPFKNWNSRS